jgi:pimeloyl-ACP methyl ester carboxylesterase
MSNARCVSFRNAEGAKLHGMLHEPDPRIARGVCLLLLSPGIKGRVGPHRLYLKMADRLVGMGFHVLRFDFAGLGDSEGAIDESVLAHVYNSIQSGRYVGDTIAAMDWMMHECGVDRFVGSGLCGGSITALLAGAGDQRVRSMLALSIPTVLDGGEANWGRFATDRQLVDVRRGYLMRLVKPDAWRRLLTGKTNYRTLWRSLRSALPRTVGNSPAAAAPVKSVAPPPDDTNPKFAPAFLRFLRSKRPMLLVFSGGDRLQWDFEEKFVARNRSHLESLASCYEVRTIANANHILSDPAWVRELLDLAAGWLDRVHPAPR